MKTIMFSILIVCFFALVAADSPYASDSILDNSEDSPVWKSSNGLVLLRPPTRRSLDDLGPYHSSKDAEDMKWLGLGVLSDMKGFFDTLQNNMDALEEPRDQKKENTNFLDKDLSLQIPPGYAFRHQRPSHKIRNFVQYSDGQNLRRSNLYDPHLLWSGLGKRR